MSWLSLAPANNCEWWRGQYNGSDNLIRSGREEVELKSQGSSIYTFKKLKGFLLTVSVWGVKIDTVFAGVTQLAESLPSKQVVAGSNPVSRSIKLGDYLPRLRRQS